MNGSAYRTTLNKISSNNNSNWILLEHNNYNIKKLVLIPKYFFYDNIVEPRKPLSDTARRAGWQGCRINLKMIPPFGKIVFVKDGKEIKKKIINYKLKQSQKFKNSNLKEKNWKLEILYLIDIISENIFTLKELEKQIQFLQQKHPTNNNIDAKIRQKSQELRDDGYLLFLDKGLYQKLF